MAGPSADALLTLERRKTRALLAVLAVDGARMVPRGKLTALLWDERAEVGARHALRQCILDLRQALAKAGVEALRTDHDSIGLDPSRVVVDVCTFNQHAADATPDTLEHAVALYRGDLLEGFSLEEPAFEDWLRTERETLRSRAVAAMRKLLAYRLSANAMDGAIDVGIRLLALEPFDETVHRSLMRLYAESGRRSAALRQYEDCVDVLARELRAEPEAETRELYRRLVAQQPRATARAVKPTTARQKSVSRDVGVVSVVRRGPQAPLIGREAELKWLGSLRETALRGQPQLAFVIGEAGIGKTRLVHEFAVHGQHRRALVLAGRGREGEDVLPFAPWIEALRPVLDDDVVARLTPVTRQDLGRLFPDIVDGPAPAPGGLEDGPRIFEAVANALRELASRQLVIVFLDDLHWCDDMTIRLLKFVPRRLNGRTVVLLGSARPEEMADTSRRRLLEEFRQDDSCASLILPPLSRDETMQLLRNLVAANYDVAQTVADRVWTLSEGNPFVVTQCARAVLDRDPSPPGALLRLPDEVRALTARCFTDLSGRAARLADVAAVIGRDFDVTVLRHAAGLSEEESADGLEELVRRRVLREAGGRFDFSHDRVREIGYARLLGPRRALLHRRVAAALEEIYAADLSSHFAAIGTHYRHAGASPEACDYLARAGFQAWERGAGRESLACFEDALGAITSLPDTNQRRELHVHLRLATNGAHVATGSYERGRHHLHEAEKLASSLADRRWEGRVAAALSNSLRATGDYDHALRCGQRALAIGRALGDRRLESVAALVLGSLENNRGNFRRSLEYLLPLIEGATPGPDFAGPFLSQADQLHGLQSAARHWIVLGYVELGEFQAGMGLVKDWLQHNDTVSDPLGTSRLMAYNALGRLNNALGDFDAAVVAYDAGFAIYREDCHRAHSRPLGWGRGLAYALAGRVAEGVDLLQRAVESEREIGSIAFKDMLMLHLGRALLVAGMLEDASRAVREALAWASDHGDRAAAAGAYGLLGEIARAREPFDPEEMERHLTEALTRARAIEMRPLAARCHLRLAWLYERAGRPEHETHAAAAASLLEQMGHPRSLDAAGLH